MTVGTHGQVKWAKVAKKSSAYYVTHKKLAPPTKKIFLRVQLQDLPRLLTLRPGL